MFNFTIINQRGLKIMFSKSLLIIICNMSYFYTFINNNYNLLILFLL